MFGGIMTLFTYMFLIFIAILALIRLIYVMNPTTSLWFEPIGNLTFTLKYDDFDMKTMLVESKGQELTPISIDPKYGRLSFQMV